MHRGGGIGTASPTLSTMDYRRQPCSPVSSVCLSVQEPEAWEGGISGRLWGTAGPSSCMTVGQIYIERQTISTNQDGTGSLADRSSTSHIYIYIYNLLLRILDPCAPGWVDRIEAGAAEGASCCCLAQSFFAATAHSRSSLITAIRWFPSVPATWPPCRFTMV